MSAPMHAALPVVENVRLARDTYRVRLAGPALAAAIRPGQFLMLRLPRTSDPLLGRPFALYDTVLDDGQPVGVDVVYLVVGKMTSRLAQVRAGDTLDVWGPLGNGFPTLDGVNHVGLVAGGIGQTPFLAYVREMLGERGYGGRPAKRSADRVSVYYGVRSADLAAGVDDFRAAGATVHLATDDGSLGEKGFVTQLLERHGPPNHLVGCGPEPMLHALTSLARRWATPCHVSLETPMACGVGVCFSCVVKVKVGDGWDYKRCCVEGPVFDAASLADDTPSAAKSMFLWETLREISVEILALLKPVPGLRCAIDLTSGERIEAWRSTCGSHYFCHGLTFGGVDAPGRAISPLSGSAVESILRRYFVLVKSEVESKPDDILVWRGVPGSPGGTTPHSAILTHPVVVAGKPYLDGVATRLRSKNGLAMVAEFSLDELFAIYGESYEVYRRQP